VAAMQQSLFPNDQPADRKTGTDTFLDFSSKRHNILAELNEAQYEAVTTIDGPLLVVAGAGSGKTRTLVYRVAHLVEQGIAPENILLLTFTRKAAQEMLLRAGRLMDDSCDQVTGGTFHAVASLLLRRYGHLIGYPPSFTVIDRGDAEGIINILKSSLNLAGAGRQFPSKRMIINIISKAVNRAVDIEDIVIEEYGHLEEFLSDILVIKDHYQKFKFDNSLMDYDDLLVHWKDVLQEFPEARQEMADRFTHIMVDEYQDTNHIQAEIVRLLAQGRNNVMVVGDDSQSIYSFRGADFRNIMDFPKVFPDTRVIKLEENYRSTQPILSLSNEIISRAETRYTKTLFTRIEDGVRPELFEGKDAGAEARFVVDTIEKLLRDDDNSAGEIAVLFRSGFHSYKLEMELAARHINFEKRGGMKLTESAHIKDMLSYFRLLVNSQDYLSWNRILLMLDKVGPKTAQNILAGVKNADDPLEALASYPAGKSWKQGLSLLVETLTRVQGEMTSPASAFDILLEYYRPVFERIYYDDFPKRSRDLEQLRGIIEEYDDLVSFVNDTTLDPPESSMKLDGQGSGDNLVLSTIHSAKGLEWDTVFVINLAEGKFPMAHITSGEQYEEERRLLYVAVTRARKRLYLSYPKESMSADRRFQYSSLSPYLAEIGAGLYTRSGSSSQGGYGMGQGSHRRYGFTPGYPKSPPVKTGKAPGLTEEELIVGLNVTHPFFGRGVVQKVPGGRSVEVKFDRHGTKLLHLDYAKLELVKN
jgi:DNA helicase-2/ATP-dependent DNA helicase PcrA